MTEATKASSETKHPPGYWWVKAVLGLSIAGLGALELFSTRSVSPVVIPVLAALAGGPELARVIFKGSS